MTKTLKQDKPQSTSTKKQGPLGGPAEHAKMERLEGELSAHETQTRLQNAAPKAALVEPAKGWVEPKP